MNHPGQIILCVILLQIFATGAGKTWDRQRKILNDPFEERLIM